MQHKHSFSDNMAPASAGPSRSINPRVLASSTAAKQKLLYEFQDSSLETLSDVAHYEDDDGEDNNQVWRQRLTSFLEKAAVDQGSVALHSNTSQHGQRRPHTTMHKDTFLAMLKHKWEEAVEALQGYRIEEAYRRMKDVLNSCHKENFEHPLAGPLHANVGILHWHLGELHGAERYFTKAIDDEPEVAIHRFLHGCVCFELGEHTEALKSFDSCLSMFLQETKTIDCSPLGLKFVLQRKAVVHNYNASYCMSRVRRKQESDGQVIGIFRVAGMIIFRPLDNGASAE
jgi:tetratricopeptide (TPR) repeat protein